MKLYEAAKEFLQWRKRQNHAAPTVIQNESNLRQFSIFARNCDLAAVTEGMVLDYLALLEDEMEIKNNSLIPKVNALRQFFKYFNERGVGALSYLRIPLRRKDFTLPRTCTHEEFQKFWEVVAKPSKDSRHIRNAALVAIISATAIRNGEACSLEIANIDVYKSWETANGKMYRGVVKTEKSKGMRPFREIFWNEEMNGYIKAWVERRAEISRKHAFVNPDILFVGLNSKFGDLGWGRKLTPNAVDELFRRYSKIAGVRINPHELRHMLGIDMAEQDASEHVIAEILGHSRLESSRQYTKLHGQRAGEQFARFRGDSRRAAT